MPANDWRGVSRRQMLSMIGAFAGSAALYQSLSALSFAAESDYRGPIKLEGAKSGASVVILGAGIAGLVAAYELRAAGYKVKVLELNARAGGRCWTLRGGDTVTEEGQPDQRCEFSQGQYFNPGPWRIPYHHHAVLDYCKRLGVVLEPFMQINYNARVHSAKALGGKTISYRELLADYQGHVAELLAKASMQGNLDSALSLEDREKLLESLRSWGALDQNMRYLKGPASSLRRGYVTAPGGGLMPEAELSQPIGVSDLLQSGLWQHLSAAAAYNYQPSMFQPVGGMDMISQAFAKSLGDLIQYGAQITEVMQTDTGVTVTFNDQQNAGKTAQFQADWCICTLPLSIVRALKINLSAPVQQAVAAVPYAGSYKAGLEFKRRFWEQDDLIFGGITYTDLPISGISYPSTGYGSEGPAVLLAGYAFADFADQYADMAPAARIRDALTHGQKIHPQYPDEFQSGVSVAWRNIPWVKGCYGNWTDELRATHYQNLCQLDGRIVLAGEHASHIPAWLEGAVLSSLDAVKRLHAKAIA